MSTHCDINELFHQLGHTKLCLTTNNCLESLCRLLKQFCLLASHKLVNTCMLCFCIFLCDCNTSGRGWGDDGVNLETEVGLSHKTDWKTDVDLTLCTYCNLHDESKVIFKLKLNHNATCDSNFKNCKKIKVTWYPRTLVLCAVPKFITCAVWKFPYISDWKFCCQGAFLMMLLAMNSERLT